MSIYGIGEVHQCQCPDKGIKPYHAENNCGQIDTTLCRRKKQKLWLCPNCILPGDVEVAEELAYCTKHSLFHGKRYKSCPVNV